jgi:hypothetical protein
MRWVLAFVSALAIACGDSSSSLPDGGGGGDDAGHDPGGDGSAQVPHTVELTLTNRPMNAAAYSFFVAYQDGSAPWQAAPAPSGDTYTFEIHAASYGVAFGCIGNVPGSTTTQLRTVTSAHFALGERTKLAFDVPARCSDRGAANVTLSGTVTNRPTYGFTFVQFGTRTAYVGSQSGNFTLQTPPGTRDMIVAHAVPEGNGDYHVDDAVVVRDVAVTGPTTHTIDFSDAAPLQYFPVTVNVPNARVVASTTLYTANGTAVGLVRESTGWESDALAESQMRATDVYDQAISVTLQGRSATVTNATSTPGEQTFVAPPPLGLPSSAVVTDMPYPVVQTTWPAYAATVGYTWNATQQPGAQRCGANTACTIAWTAYVSPGVVGAMPGFRMPDLAAVPGWKTAFELVPGAQVFGSVTAQTSSAGAGDFPPGTPAAGTSRTFVRADFSVTP